MANGLTQLRDINTADRTAVASLLPWIGSQYPGGEEWLDKRFNEILLGRARGVLAYRSGRVAGIGITTPKETHRYKLSTLYVAPWARRRGVGSAILLELAGYWIRNNVTDVYVTFNAGNKDDAAFFEKWGFVTVGIDIDRYGPGRSEIIMSWNPSAGSPLVTALHKAQVR